MIHISSLYLLLLAGAYLIGSIPCGYWIALWIGGQDIRRYGSGNIGATNVARLLGIKYFFITFFLDAFKAYAFLVFSSLLKVPQPIIFLCALLLLFGNGYSIFLQGNGGKGMATNIGILCAIHPILFLTTLVTWLSTLIYMRNVGIASVVSVASLPLFACLVTDFYGVLLVSIMGVWIIWRHKNNLRLYYGVRS